MPTIKLDDLLKKGEGDCVVARTDNHILFCEEEPEKVAEASILDDGVERTVKMVIGGDRNNYTLHIGDFLDYDETELSEIIYALRSSGDNDTINVRINSYGGAIHQATPIINVLREQFNGNIVMYLDSIAFSAGASLFVNGDKRVVYESSQLMFHWFSGSTHGQGNNMLDQAKFANKIEDRLTRKELIAPGYLTEAEYELMKIGKEVWLDVDDMILRGIATHVIVDNAEMDAEAYLEYITSGFTKDEFLEYYEELKAEEGVYEVEFAEDEDE